jgi:1,4-alpha-glucan branching enzyme
MPDGEKTAFQVWAPHAWRAAVIGRFNGWDGGRNPMDPEGDGCWHAEVRRRFPGRLLSAEDLRDNPEMNRPVEGGALRL